MDYSFYNMFINTIVQYLKKNVKLYLIYTFLDYTFVYYSKFIFYIYSVDRTVYKKF